MASSVLVEGKEELVLDYWERELLPRMMTVKSRTISTLIDSGLRAEKSIIRMEKCGVRQGSYAPARCTCRSTNYCPFCISLRAKQQRDWLKHRVLWKAPRNISWFHVTSAVTNCDPDVLNVHALAVITGTARLMKHPKIKPMLVGSASAFEFTPANEPALTTAHVHSLVGLKTKRGQTLPSSETWKLLWQDLCPREMARDIVVKALRKSTDVVNVVDYITKDAEYADIPHRDRDNFITRWNERLNRPERFMLEVKMTTRKRRFFGSLIRPKTVAERRAWKAPWDKDRLVLAHANIRVNS